MNTIEERYCSNCQCPSCEGCSNWDKVEGATEQKEIDEHEHNNSLNALYEKHQKQLAKYDADLKETQRQRDEYFNELVKFRIERAEWMEKACEWIHSIIGDGFVRYGNDRKVADNDQFEAMFRNAMKK